MILAVAGHSYVYETEKIVRLFFPFEKLVFSDTLPPETDGFLTAVNQSGLCVRLQIAGIREEKTADFPGREALETALCMMLYKLLCEYTGCVQPWGILTGVRPGKLFRKLASERGEAEAKRVFTDAFLVDPEKTELCADCVKNESAIIEKSGQKSFSLYIAVPFCPSRCKYCSFVSHSVERSKALIPEYLRLLTEEIRITGEIAGSIGLKLSTVYIGGGTPSVLTAEQIEMLLKSVSENFHISDAAEFTFEAGRPETVTGEKLKVLDDGNVTRISINPQTFHDRTLRLVNRRHTAEDMYKAFELARECYSGDINIDLIAGLESETVDDFNESVSRAIALKPENITVHTLSVKRAAAINKAPDKTFWNNASAVAKMLSSARQRLSGAGYVPYYLYRQSKTVGNAENTGYSLREHECFYNVYMMDETHTVLGCGASAVTKLKAYGTNTVKRVFNFKYPYEYINRFSEITERKSEIKQFYNQYPFEG